MTPDTLNHNVFICENPLFSIAPLRESRQDKSEAHSPACEGTDKSDNGKIYKIAL